MRYLYRIGRKTTSFLGLEGLVYRVARKFIFDSRNENNADMATNGETSFLMRNILKMKIIFDVGANVGEYTKSVLSIAGSVHVIPEVHCFEPSHYTFKKLQANNFPRHVSLNNIALGASSGEAVLHIIEEGSGGNSLYKRTDVKGVMSPSAEEKVHISTIDSYCRGKNIEVVDLIKVDTEGYEMEVLKGARDMMSEQRINVIQFEYGGCWITSRIFLKDVFDFFKPLGYTVYKIFPDRVVSIPEYAEDLENFQLTTYCAVKNSFVIQ